MVERAAVDAVMSVTDGTTRSVAVTVTKGVETVAAALRLAAWHARSELRKIASVQQVSIHEGYGCADDGPKRIDW